MHSLPADVAHFSLFLVLPSGVVTSVQGHGAGVPEDLWEEMKIGGLGQGVRMGGEFRQLLLLWEQGWPQMQAGLRPWPRRHFGVLLRGRGSRRWRVRVHPALGATQAREVKKEKI